VIAAPAAGDARDLTVAAGVRSSDRLRSRIEPQADHAGPPSESARGGPGRKVSGRMT
jgi:hypothetical protein